MRESLALHVLDARTQGLRDVRRATDAARV